MTCRNLPPALPPTTLITWRWPNFWVLNFGLPMPAWFNALLPFKVDWVKLAVE